MFAVHNCLLLKLIDIKWLVFWCTYSPHTDLHGSAFLLSKVKNWWHIWPTLYTVRTKKCWWLLNSWEDDKTRVFGLSRYWQEVCPGQTWVTSSNWNIWISLIRTFQLLWHHGSRAKTSKTLGVVTSIWFQPFGIFCAHLKLKNQNDKHEWHRISQGISVVTCLQVVSADLCKTDSCVC